MSQGRQLSFFTTLNLIGLYSMKFTTIHKDMNVIYVSVWSLLQQPSFLVLDLQLAGAQCDLLHVLQDRVWIGHRVEFRWIWWLPGTWQHCLLLRDDHCQCQSWTGVRLMELAHTCSYLGLDW